MFNFLVELKASYWDTINLPHFYNYPDEQPYKYIPESKIFSILFPTAPKNWFFEEKCKEYRMTSTRWMSNLLNDVKGISFKGLVYKKNLGKRENEFAFYFHEKECYDGGAEYGWVFPESHFGALFYLCGNCNLENQNWCQWPGDPNNKGTCKASGDCQKVAQALKNPAKYKHWNIKVNENGSFLIELVDPVNWKYISCTIEKPDWFPNLYLSPGYVTINAQKLAEETVSPTPVMHVDEVKVWK